MDDRIGRLVANSGADRTATERAVRIVERWPSRARPIRCTRKSSRHFAEALRAIRGTRTLCELGSICVSFNSVMAAGSRRMTATARSRAAAAILGEANGHAREQAWASAAGEAAGAILGRSQQI